MDATVEADIGDLSGLGNAMDRRLSGVLRMNAHAAGNVQTLVLRDGTIDGTIRNLSLGDPAIDEVIGDHVTVSANYAVDADSGSLEATIQAGEALNAQLDGTLTDGLQRLMATWRIEAPRLDVIGEAFDVPIAGAFISSGTAEGDLADPSIVATARLADASIAAFAIANAELNVNAQTITRAPSGEISLKATTEAGPVDVNARFATPEGGRFSVGSLSAQIPGVSLSGNADVDLATNTAVGRLQGNLNAPRGVEFVGTRIAGTGALDVRLDQAAGQQTIAFDLSAGSVAVSTGGKAQFQAGSVAASGRILDAFGTPGVEARLTAQDIGAADALARSVTASLDGPMTGAAFRLAVSEFGEPPLAVSANGTLGLEDEAVRVQLQQLQGFIGEYPFTLQRSASVVYRAPAIVIDDFALDVAGGELRVDGTIGGVQTAATIDAALPAEVAGVAAGMELRGMIEARAELREQGGLLAGTVEVRAADIVQMIGTVAAGPPIDADVTVNLSNGRASADGQVHGLGPTPLVLTGEIPLAVDIETLQPRARETTPIRAQVNWRGDLQGLTQLLPVPDQRVAGEAIIDFGVRGTLERPVASGQILVRNGTYEHLTYGTLIRNLDLTVAVRNAQTVQITLTGTDGGAGRINAEGRANLGEREPIVLDVEFGGMTLVRRDDVRAAASGNLSYRGTATAGKLSGRVETNGVEVSLLGHMPPTVVTLDVVEVRDGQRIDATPPAAETAPGLQEAPDETPDETIALDLTLLMPNRVFVRGRGLDSEWQGNLDVTGTISNVRVVGVIQVIRGTFDLVGTEFDLENSAISFDGDRQITPRLNIQATHEARDITATILVTGTPAAPELTLTSTPSLPESEILAQVLFGRASRELGPAELVEIAMALDTLAGGGGGVSGGTLGTLRETFGLARLSVGTDEAGAPVLRAGRYVTDRVYVETVQGARAGSSKFRVEVELTDQLALEAETGDVSQNTGEFVGLRWRYDY
jgi:translocation and assembly module TamB